MAGTKLLHEFVQGRNQRSNAFISQSQALSGAVPDEKQRRQAIAANVRVPVSATKLQTPPPSTRPQQAAQEHVGPSFGASEQQKGLHGVRTDGAEGNIGRDVFDTDVEDLTESLFSDPSQQGDQLVGMDRGPQSGVPSNGQQAQPRTEKHMFHASGQLIPYQRPGNQMNGAPSSARDDSDHSDTDSGASDNMELQDDQTLTFTPEQAARVQQVSMHAVQVAERPKSRLQNTGATNAPRKIETKDLYDVSSQRPQSSSYNLNQLPIKDSLPPNKHHGFRRIVSGDDKARHMSLADPHEARKPEVLHRIATSAQHGKGPFEPSDAAEDEDDMSESDAHDQRGTPSPPPAVEVAASASIGAVVAATDLDYSPEVLAGMPYDKLASQPFDANPNPPPSVLPPSHIGAPLSTQLAHVVNLPSAQQTQFCASITASQWEDCGDWFVEQFAFLTGKMKEARREKRRVAMGFEEEIAARERLVRAKTEGFEKVLEGMRRGGQGLLGRDPA